MQPHHLDRQVDDELRTALCREGQLVGFVVELRQSYAGVEQLPDVGMRRGGGVVPLDLAADVRGGNFRDRLVRIVFGLGQCLRIPAGYVAIELLGHSVKRITDIIP